MNYAIFTTTQEGLIDFWNPGAERIYGYHEAEILGQHMAILFTPEDRKRGLPEQEMRIATAESRASDERYHLRKDGKRFYASGVLTPLLAGARHGFAKIARDLTARKQMEEDLHQADRRKDEFLATLAHELRNPLAPLYSGLEILRLEKKANGGC
ncbi:MAG: PAS domain S-box protein [Thermaceae bacterium]|nr:PAS domain S-box protein [Thermaceae bacterium]